MNVDNAIIMAAGTSSRFAPLSYEMPKGLLPVRGEVLIERQIRQLQEAGVPKIYVVTGYRAEDFAYLREKCGVELLHNPDYLTRNNHASLYAARHVLGNSYVCSADNYFAENPFEREVLGAYYAAEFAAGETAEWCMEENDEGFVTGVTIGGQNAWYMMGHTFWDAAFSRQMLVYLEEAMASEAARGQLWEAIFAAHLDTLRMKIRKYEPGVIFEFDALEELRAFDPAYRTHSGSRILATISQQLGVPESDIDHITALYDTDNAAVGFRFTVGSAAYRYLYAAETWERVEQE